MGKLVVTEFVSIDGVFEDPGGAETYEHGGWTFEYDRGEDGDKFKMDELMEADVAWPARPSGCPTCLASGPRRGAGHFDEFSRVRWSLLQWF